MKGHAFAKITGATNKSKRAEETLPKLETPFESAELCGVACCPRHRFARVLVPS